MQYANPKDHFKAISIKIASPERIREWSFGEVTKPETINYRTQRSERAGLFDERIFGPEKDYECYCGKYRRIRYKDIICEKCGVEVTRSIVRRERMGHIELASPVAHIWFLRGGGSSRIGNLLGMTLSDLERVVYFAGYLITHVNENERNRILKDLDAEYRAKVKTIESESQREKIKQSMNDLKKEIESIRVGRVIDEPTYHGASLRYGGMFDAEIGAEAVYKICASLDLGKLADELERELEHAPAAERIRIRKRLNLARSLLRAGSRPEWMFLTVVPVTPPALRPMVALDGGRHATSDINDLYRRVINRNNRLKKLKDIGAPEVIQRNEKRILQEAVDALIDNSIRYGTQGAVATSQGGRRPLKSLADMLKGKQGRFRGNLLGKRVDYSGRSVIVVGPELKLHQCGLPKHMALELFRPFVISKILAGELAYNIRGAGRLIEEGAPEVWAILEEVIKDKYVLLNRAPTLHRLGIQAFQPILIEGNAIQLHPLVCTAFNADFDGDQMAVHVPLTPEAQREARELMASNKNLLRPGSGDPIVTPRQDMILGCYWMTKLAPGTIGEGELFASTNSAILAHDLGRIDFRAPIKLKASDTPKYREFAGSVFETTVGRLLFNSVLPSDFPFINRDVTSKEIGLIMEQLISRYGTNETPSILDKIKDLGYRYAMASGISLGLSDFITPPIKLETVSRAKADAATIDEKYAEGYISDDERYRMLIEVWQGVKDIIEDNLLTAVEKNGAIVDIITSKARGTLGQLNQMTGMKGLIQGPTGRINELPIISSYIEGLSPLEYFITTHGSRKGQSDTALNTAKSGYLTRRLVDVAQESVILLEDCKDTKGRRYSKKNAFGLETNIANSIRGRILAKTITAESGETIFKAGYLLSKEDASLVGASGIEEVYARSPLSCLATRGICQKCYGYDLGRNQIVSLGEAVGIVAAQAIGEPGTQLTMRTFHAGGIASAEGDITMGLPRVDEIFERRSPANPAVIAHDDGEVIEISRDRKEKRIVILGEGGKKAKQESITYPVLPNRTILVDRGARVKKGDILTDGAVDISELFKYGGKEAAENYIIREIIAVYSLQGEAVSPKHVEVIVRQMFSRRKITSQGGTRYIVGEVVDAGELEIENAAAQSRGEESATVEALVLGITEVALNTSSWLSAASFLNTTRVLIDASIAGKTDRLRGVKENVIVGKLVPVGTGYHAERSVRDKTETIDPTQADNESSIRI
ncbi:MAG: DNA-directed RNA polymerase subunit beta' [Candidatus Vogelbacteria bacterium]|nr:DNA-directed RNA polymerase subunit beta' [Candidatus Vogelbacteria bacterium]